MLLVSGAACAGKRTLILPKSLPMSRPLRFDVAPSCAGGVGGGGVAFWGCASLASPLLASPLLSRELKGLGLRGSLEDSVCSGSGSVS